MVLRARQARTRHALLHQGESRFGVRGLYKDIVGASSEFADYQFRPNRAIGMTFAPDLFDEVHAVNRPNLVEERHMGPVGMKTLEASDFPHSPCDNNVEDTGGFLS
jgi:glycogen debranching enzyme